MPNLFVKNKNCLNNLTYITTLDLPLFRKKFVPRTFSCKYIRIFSASSTRSNVSSLFVKIATSLKRWYNVDVFLKIFFSRQLISGTCSKSICWLSCNFTKINSIGYTILHWMVLNMKHLLEKKSKICKLFHGNKIIHLFPPISEYVIRKKFLSLLYFHHS